MKKILLLFYVVCLANYLNAQCNGTLPVYEDFSNTYLINTCWTKIDADGDGLGWTVSSMDASGNKGLKSRSFGRTPDNWIISNAINLTSSSDILSWRVRATYWQYDEENYTVYVSTGNQISDFTASSVFFTENLGGSDASGVFANRSLNISSFAGQTVYIAFRHYNVTDQLEIDIDDFAIAGSGAGLAIEDFNKENFKFYYNSNNETLVIKSSNNPISSVIIYNILGQSVVNRRSSEFDEEINLSNFVDGVYIAQIEIDNTVKSIKFIKQ